MRRRGLSDESRVDIFVEEFPEGFLLDSGEEIYWTRRNGFVVFKFDLEIVWSVGSQSVCLCVVEDFSILMVLGRHMGEVGRDG